MSTAPKTTYLADYHPPSHLITTTQLEIEISEEKTRVISTLAFKKNPASTTNQPLVLNGENLALQHIALDQQTLDEQHYTITDTALTLHNTPDSFTLTTEVWIYPKKNTLLMGLYCSNNNYCTQCEPEGFRRITYYIDRPDILSLFTVSITADKSQYPHLLSNGNLIATEELENNHHKAVWHDPSLKPCYLFALVAGDFDVIKDTFITQSQRTIDLAFYVEKGFKNQSYFAMNALKDAMAWDEATFGREYDLDIYMVVAVSDFLFGAMENKGLNIFNTKYVLAEEKTATDNDYLGIQTVIGHEYFHNWSGNRVTCRDWFQLTLKEGLTVFRDECFSTDMTSASIKRISDVCTIRNGQFREDSGPLAHPIRPESYITIDNFYTSTVYRKGAEIIRMVQTLLTPEKFRAALDLYFSRFDGQAVTTDDFIQVMEESSGIDLSQFKRWYSQAGTPQLKITDHYDAATHTYSLTIAQSCPPTPDKKPKKPFHMPIAIALLSKNGQLLKLNEQHDTSVVLHLTQQQETYDFKDIPEKPIPSLLRNFSAPVNVQYAYSEADSITIMTHDTDTITRWDAAQRLQSQIILKQAKDNPSNSNQLSPTLIQAFSQIAEQPNSDITLATEILSLPSIENIYQQDSAIDIITIAYTQLTIKKALGSALENIWLEQYSNYHTNQPYNIDINQITQRTFKNLCLHYLVSTENDDYLTLAAKQFNEANNMTDTLGALLALNQFESEIRHNALNEFYEQWKDEPLVINKWLTLQAQLPAETTFESVKQLTEHTAFSIENPNNIYALIGSFTNNIFAFHGGEYSAHYAFIADLIIKLNQINPLTASRIITPLTKWKALDSARGDSMKQELVRILNTPNLASSLYELTEKSLT